MKEACGIHDTSFLSFLKRGVDIRKDLYTNDVRRSPSSLLSPAEVVGPRTSVEESPVAIQGTRACHCLAVM